ncbi:hypothetical protein L5876_09780 [Hyphobacterium sp. SN044]|nr:hypothetical protein [Hyphobacterium sp. SN044]MCF8880104.1 hypothetical protein [Hyphobacterium sp. SN044]
MSTNPFRYFKTSPEVIRLAVMMYVRFPLSLRNEEDLLHECGIAMSYETVRDWWNRFEPMLAAEIRRKRASRLRAWPQWQWHFRRGHGRGLLRPRSIHRIDLRAFGAPTAKS